MGLRKTLESVHGLLESAGIDHALIGGLGLAALGVHRATFDVDLLVPESQKEDLKSIMEQAGWKIVLETPEVLHFEGLGQVDCLLARRPPTLQMLREARPTQMGLKCLSAEGIIALKIQAYKNDPEREFQDKVTYQEKSKMTFEQYLAWLDEYWEIFGPPTLPKRTRVMYRNVRL